LGRAVGSKSTGAITVALMKTSYKVKVTAQIDGRETEEYAEARVVDDGRHDRHERELKFESVQEFIRYLLDHPEDFPKKDEV
jgi:hypothetical protein